MRTKMLRRARTAGGLAVVASVSLALPAQAMGPPAKPIACGSVITASTTLTVDIGPCRRGGLVIGASGITLNLGGHTVSGIDRTGDGAGILFKGVSGSTVTNGTVTAFDSGVSISGGGSNTVTGLTAANNVGTQRSGVGEGILIQASSGNHVTNNTVSGNGPFGGISIVNDAADATQVANGNEIANNAVTNNNNQSGNINMNQVDGIRIEGPGAANTLITGNTVTGSGLDGIAVFADQGSGRKNTGTQIVNNTVTGNGFNDETHRKGDGIALFGSPTNAAVGGADSTTVQGNQVHGNAANGIWVASKTNTITGNDATGNTVITKPTSTPDAYDLTDRNTAPPCDANAWSTNLYNSRSLTCIS